MTRFEKLMKRYHEKKGGSINPDLMAVIDAPSSLDDIKMRLRFAEAELSHAMKGLDHEDYDSVFEEWTRCE